MKHFYENKTPQIPRKDEGQGRMKETVLCKKKRAPKAVKADKGI